MRSKKKILVISPHADDEVLGVGGYLLHEKKSGSEILIIIGALGGKDSRQNLPDRQRELESVCQQLGADFKVLYEGFDAELDTIPSFKITSALDRIIDSFRPDEIFINYSSHHQDHKKLFDCSMASLRLREGYSPQLVALYEYPFVGGHYDYINGGRWYHDISDVIDEKVALFNLYESQVRKSPSPLNYKGITALSRIRGVESGFEYAEMFYVQKLVK